ncbi:unnamed protein product [Cercopithifilaria johnstoni]|uniref:Uncharacterized protein n=1 Tax=Cercopithifilaria johnstoni TaxID=2874296 RepID=A0A8J2MNQ2_9BILA|nr:unnamed protein product [Cercopithifilaria johnstoni]
MTQVQEEQIEMNQSYDDSDLKNEEIVPNWNDNSIPVVDKGLSEQHSEISYEQQQHGILGTTVSSVLSSLPTGNMTIISDNVDDESDEFYDASSDFNDVPLASTTGSTLFDTANIISSTIASQNDSRDKVILNGSLLEAVSECIEPSADSIAKSVSLPGSNGSRYEARQIRQINTARVRPMIPQNVLYNIFFFQISQRSSLLDKSKSPYGLAKSHSPSTQPDLKDIKSIVERQEAELRQELNRLKSSVQGEIASKTLPSGTRKSEVHSARSGMTPLTSSRSIEFNPNGAKLSIVAGPSPIFHASRLPTPVRKSLGRSLIPTPRASVLSRSAIRALAGGSTPSLVLSSQHIYDDTRSECGGISHNEQQWADECF